MASSLNELLVSASSTNSLRLQDVLMPQQIEALHQIFKNTPEQKLTREQLHELFDKFLIMINDKDFENLFLKVKIVYF